MFTNGGAADCHLLFSVFAARRAAGVESLNRVSILPARGAARLSRYAFDSLAPQGRTQGNILFQDTKLRNNFFEHCYLVFACPN